MALIDWQKGRPELGGDSMAEWVERHRGEETVRTLAGALSGLTGEMVTLHAMRSKIRSLTGLLSPGERKKMYALRNTAYTGRWDNPPRIEGDALVLSDCQVPYHDQEFIERCVELASKWGVSNLILAGDFADLQSLNHFQQPATMALSEELKAVRSMLSLLRRSFKRTLYIMGNHEARLGRSMDGKFSLRDVLQPYLDEEHIEFSDYYHCMVGTQWIVTHQINTSTIPGRVAFQLAAKLHANVATTHEHTAADGHDISAKFRTVAIGMCADPVKLEYYSVRHNIRPAMVQGALILKRGYDWHLHPTDTDWSALRSIKWNGERHGH